MTETLAASRPRMSHDARHAQLLACARDLIRDEGSDALTLARLAERAGVTKPLVYQHFGAKAGVFVELYREFKTRTHVALDEALAHGGTGLAEVAQIIADAYIDCIDDESAELPGVSGALSGSPELELLRQEADAAFSARCRAALQPFAPDGRVTDAALYAILGAAEGIARALVLEKIAFAESKEALAKIVVSAV